MTKDQDTYSAKSFAKDRYDHYKYEIHYDKNVQRNIRLEIRCYPLYDLIKLNKRTSKYFYKFLPVRKQNNLES